MEKDIPKENLTLSTKILHRVKRKNVLGRALFDFVESNFEISQRSPERSVLTFDPDKGKAAQGQKGKSSYKKAFDSIRNPKNRVKYCLRNLTNIPASVLYCL